MAIKLNAAYSKKLGLKNYSSHSFSVSVEVELSDPNNIGAETARLYGILQASVDSEIRHTGFVPDDDYGQNIEVPTNGNRFIGGGHQPNSNGSHSENRKNGSGCWACSTKQRQLITDLAAELSLTDEQLADRVKPFSGLPVEQINKLSASNLISALLEETNQRRKQNKKTAAA